jgi:hypothetical protein
MRIISQHPRLIGRGQWGIWRVTAIYQDGRTHSANYEAFTMAEAKRRYLMEFGKVRGEIRAEMIQKRS